MSAIARLHLYQLVSPALPVGAFSYSEGLEALVQRGDVGDAAAVHRWLQAELERGTLCLEAAALPVLMNLLELWRQAIPHSPPARRACEMVRDLSGWLSAQREAPEVRAQQRQMGGSLLRLLKDLGWPLPATPELQIVAAAAPGGPNRTCPPRSAAGWPWPVALAWAGVCLEVRPEELVEAFLYAWVASQLSAAVRLVPLGPTEAQRLQLELATLIARRAEVLAVSDPRGLWSGGVGAAMAQLEHGSLYSRLFRS
jgi:urease accessory protein